MMSCITVVLFTFLMGLAVGISVGLLALLKGKKVMFGENRG
jgi:hypothetical protein